MSWFPSMDYMRLVPGLCLLCHSGTRGARIEDGLKPVQRRIAHALKEMDDGRFNKVAKRDRQLPCNITRTVMLQRRSHRKHWPERPAS